MFGKNLDFERMDPQQIKEVFEPYNAIVPKESVEKNSLGIAFAKNKRLFAKNLNILYSKAMMHAAKTDKPFLPIPQKSEGQIRLGRYMQGELQLFDCRIDLDSLIQTSVIAAPNKGKTTLLMSLASQINRLNDSRDKKICTIIVDRRMDFRKIGDFPVLTLENLKISFFEPPPGCDPNRWLSDIAEFLMHRWQFYQRSRNFFLNTVHNLYEANRKPPTLLEVREELKNEIETSRRMSPRKHEVAEVSLDRIDNAIFEFGKSVSTRKTFPLCEFIDRGIPLIIEADLSTDSFVILLGWLLLYIYRYRKSNNMRGNVSEGGTVIICDEAYLLWQTETMYGESRRELGADLIDTSAISLRDFRVAIIAASQRSLNSDYMAATNLKIVGYCGDYEDARYLANSLGDPALVDVIARLATGQFIVKIGSQKPACIQTDDFLKQEIDDDTLKERMKGFIEYIEDFCHDEDLEVQDEKKSERAALSYDAKNLIFDILQYPESTVSARYSRLGLKGKKAQEMVEEILTTKYAELVVDAIEGPKPAKYLVLTQQAIDWLKSQGKTVDHIQHIGKVSAMHALYQIILQVYLQKSGWSVLHDQAAGKKFPDILATKDGVRVAYEVAVNGAVDPERVSSALSLEDMSEYVFLCKDLAVANSIRAQLNRLQSKKIRYLVANQFIMNLKRGILDYYHYNTENNSNNQNKPNSNSFAGEQEENRSKEQIG